MLSIVCRCVISRHMMSKCLANLSWFPVLHDLPCKSISGVPHLPFAHLSLFCPQDQQCIPSVYLKKAKRNALRMLISDWEKLGRGFTDRHPAGWLTINIVLQFLVEHGSWLTSFKVEHQLVIEATWVSCTFVGKYMLQTKIKFRLKWFKLG